MHRTAFLLLVGILLLATPALADNLITSCDQDCRADCTGFGAECVEANANGACSLSGDLECGQTWWGFSIYGSCNYFQAANGLGPIGVYGATLDLNGHTISCDTQFCDCNGENCVVSDCLDEAVLLGSGGDLKNLVTTEGVITGRFNPAVTGGGAQGTLVDGVRFVNVTEAVAGVRTVRNNVIAGGDVCSVGILPNGGSGSFSYNVSDNYIESCSVGVETPGTRRVVLNRNHIHTGGMDAAVEATNASSNVDSTDNKFFGTGADSSSVIYSFPNGTSGSSDFVGNVCDVDHPDCDSTGGCVDSGYCVPFTAPFNP